MTPPLLDQPITGATVWRGQDLARSTDWIRPLSAAALAGLDAALRAVQSRGLAWRDVRKTDFPLPGVSADLAQVNRDLEWSQLFVLLRVLALERYSEEELRTIWWGLGCHLGTAVHQNAHGELIGEVRDEVRLYGEGVQPAVPKSEGLTSRAKARSSGPLRWHTDRCDVVGLLCVRAARRGGTRRRGRARCNTSGCTVVGLRCVRPARGGGTSRVVSVPAVSNAIRERRPDLH